MDNKHLVYHNQYAHMSRFCVLYRSMSPTYLITTVLVLRTILRLPPLHTYMGYSYQAQNESLQPANISRPEGFEGNRAWRLAAITVTTTLIPYHSCQVNTSSYQTAPLQTWFN